MSYFSAADVVRIFAEEGVEVTEGYVKPEVEYGNMFARQFGEYQAELRLRCSARSLAAEIEAEGEEAAEYEDAAYGYQGEEY